MSENSQEPDEFELLKNAVASLKGIQDNNCLDPSTPVCAETNISPGKIDMISHFNVLLAYLVRAHAEFCLDFYWFWYSLGEPHLNMYDSKTVTSAVYAALRSFNPDLSNAYLNAVSKNISDLIFFLPNCHCIYGADWLNFKRHVEKFAEQIGFRGTLPLQVSAHDVTIADFHTLDSAMVQGFYRLAINDGPSIRADDILNMSRIHSMRDSKPLIFRNFMTVKVLARARLVTSSIEDAQACISAVMEIGRSISDSMLYEESKPIFEQSIRQALVKFHAVYTLPNAIIPHQAMSVADDSTVFLSWEPIKKCEIEKERRKLKSVFESQCTRNISWDGERMYRRLFDTELNVPYCMESLDWFDKQGYYTAEGLLKSLKGRNRTIYLDDFRKELTNARKHMNNIPPYFWDFANPKTSSEWFTGAVFRMILDSQRVRVLGYYTAIAILVAELFTLMLCLISEEDHNASIGIKDPFLYGIKIDLLFTVFCWEDERPCCIVNHKGIPVVNWNMKRLGNKVIEGSLRQIRSTIHDKNDMGKSTNSRFTKLFSKIRAAEGIFNPYSKEAVKPKNDKIARPKISQPKLPEGITFVYDVSEKNSKSIEVPWKSDKKLFQVSLHDSAVYNNKDTSKRKLFTLPDLSHFNLDWVHYQSPVPRNGRHVKDYFKGYATNKDMNWSTLLVTTSVKSDIQADFDTIEKTHNVFYLMRTHLGEFSQMVSCWKNKILVKNDLDLKTNKIQQRLSIDRKVSFYKFNSDVVPIIAPYEIDQFKLAINRLPSISEIGAREFIRLVENVLIDYPGIQNELVGSTILKVLPMEIADCSWPKLKTLILNNWKSLSRRESDTTCNQGENESLFEFSERVRMRQAKDRWTQIFINGLFDENVRELILTRDPRASKEMTLSEVLLAARYASAQIEDL